METKRKVEGDWLTIADPDGKILLSIREQIAADGALITVKGELTLLAAHDFEDELMGVLTVTDRVVIDLSEVTFLSSAGLKILLTIQQMLEKRRDGRLLLKEPSQTAQAVFEETGFSQLFEFAPGEEE